MKEEIWIDGRLTEAIDIDFDTPVSNSNHSRYRRWASNYIRRHNK